MGRDSRQGRAAVEDQPTDTSDLTDTGGASKDAAAGAVFRRAPTRGALRVGKRGGRHRTFRPRPVAAGPGSSDTAAGDAAEETVEAESPAVEAEPPAVEETVESEIPAEPSPKAKRRRWFRGRADKAADATAEAEAAERAEAEVVEEPPAPSQIG